MIWAIIKIQPLRATHFVKSPVILLIFHSLVNKNLSHVLFRENVIVQMMVYTRDPWVKCRRMSRTFAGSLPRPAKASTLRVSQSSEPLPQGPLDVFALQILMASCVGVCLIHIDHRISGKAVPYGHRSGRPLYRRGPGRARLCRHRRC